MKKNSNIFTYAIIIVHLIFIEQVYAQTLYTTSRDCQSKCLAVTGRTFCPTDDKKSGYCCTSSNSCPKSSFGYCSNDFKNSTIMQAFMCPLESYCGASNYRLEASTTTQFLKISNVTSSSSLTVYPNGGICQYQMAGPSNMTQGDQLLILIVDAY
jgi:hypothetical protein